MSRIDRIKAKRQKVKSDSAHLKLLKDIHSDLIERANMNGTDCVELGSGNWFRLCEAVYGEDQLTKDEGEVITP